MGSIDTLLDPADLRRLAGQGSFERGSEYAASGRVARLGKGTDQVTARVDGSHAYRVKLWVVDDHLVASCDCPVGERGSFCKHCVAVGLVAAAVEADEATLPASQIRAYLDSLPREKLVGLLMDEAGRDELLFERLTLRADTEREEFDPDSAREMISRAVDPPGGFVTYQEAAEYARQLDDALDLLGLIAEQADPSDAVTLIEHACVSVEGAAATVDDSDGFLTSVFEQLQRQHLDVSQRAGFEPTVLAERLFALMMATDYELFYDAVDEYSELLGEPGTKHYAELVRDERERLPTAGPGDDRPWRGNSYRIEYVSELLARQSGDVDELVTIWSRDLSLPYRYVRIAEALAEAGRYGEAIEWAERGHEAFPDHHDTRLVRFLAAALNEWGESDRALKLMWGEFERNPSVENYAQLKPYAEAIGSWVEVRSKALDLIAERIEAWKAKAANRGPTGTGTGESLVRIHLWEQDISAALEAAREHGCGQQAWLELAERIEESEPGAAADIYREPVETIISGKTKASYRHAVLLITKVRDLLAESGRVGEFPAFLDEVRETHRRKRTLMKMLDEIET